MGEKKLFGKGVYGSKDVPIKILDKLIIGIVVLIVIFVFVFATNGGFYVQFETAGGTQITSEKLGYGAYVTEPIEPTKPGYTFVQWVTSEDESIATVWNFSEHKVEEDMTLYAIWKPATMLVKFDPNGGTMDDTISSQEVIYGEEYGSLPVPTKENAVFDGWVYSGSIIAEDTLVTMTGEHVLTAIWK